MSAKRTNGIPIIRSRDRLAEAIVQADKQKRAEAWGAAFEANAREGAPSLLAFLLAGVQYDATTVLKTAVEIIAAMKTGGYLIIRADQFEAQVLRAMAEVRARQEEASAGDQG